MYAFWYFLIDKCLEREIVASAARLSNSQQRPVGLYQYGFITRPSVMGNDTRQGSDRATKGAVDHKARHSLGTRAQLKILVSSLEATLVKRNPRTFMKQLATRYPTMGERYCGIGEEINICGFASQQFISCTVTCFLLGSPINERISEQSDSLCTNDNVHSRWVPHRTGRTYCS